MKLFPTIICAITVCILISSRQFLLIAINIIETRLVGTPELIGKDLPSWLYDWIPLIPLGLKWHPYTHESNRTWKKLSDASKQISNITEDKLTMRISHAPPSAPHGKKPYGWMMNKNTSFHTDEIDCVQVLNITASRMHGNVGLEFSGRMCNNMIQYIHARIHAARRGSGLVESGKFGTDLKFGKHLEKFSNVQWKRLPGATTQARALCGGTYAQSYSYLVRHRHLSKCLFSPRFLLPQSKNSFILKPSDVVIHVRNPFEDGERVGSKKSSLQNNYYASILSRIAYSQIYIVSSPALYKHEIVQNLIQQFSAKIHEDTPQGDWFLAVLAPTLIGSFGTYTWMASFLSEGHSIHLPYLSNLKEGADWCPWKDLFIHDDPRITYHDVANANFPTSETAAAVMARSTTFANALRQRRDPCPEL